MTFRQRDAPCKAHSSRAPAQRCAGHTYWRNASVDVRSQSLLGGRKGLVVGIANEHSIAYGCARMFRDSAQNWP